MSISIRKRNKTAEAKRNGTSISRNATTETERNKLQRKHNVRNARKRNDHTTLKPKTNGPNANLERKRNGTDLETQTSKTNEETVRGGGWESVGQGGMA